MMNNQMLGMLSQLKQDPVSFLMQRRLNLPQGVATGDPQAILNHLVQSGQISQQQINNAYQMMQRLK